MCIRDPIHQPPDGVLTRCDLLRQNRQFHGTGGCSGENHAHRFQPAFLDTCNDRIYLSRFADGRPAPMHLLDGLPAELVVRRDTSGEVYAVRPGIVAGFVRDDRFYTREEAAAAIRGSDSAH